MARHVRIFVLLGQGGTFFSGGMFDLTRRLKMLGNTIVTTHEWSDVQTVHDMAKQIPPRTALVFIGFSLGANSTTSVAWALAYNEPRVVDLIVGYDPSRFWGSVIMPIRQNVKRTICYWNKNAWTFGGQKMTGHNVEVVEINKIHLLVASDAVLHDRTIAAVKQLME